MTTNTLPEPPIKPKMGGVGHVTQVSEKEQEKVQEKAKAQ